VGVQAQGIKTACETSLLFLTAGDYSTAVSPGSIVHSPDICEKNFREDAEALIFEKSSGERMAKLNHDMPGSEPHS
jgi:hypothetical protein